MITAIRPTLNPSGLYAAKQAREALEISASSLRNYVNAGLIGYKTGRNGRRYFYGAAVMKLYDLMHKAR